MIFRGSKETKRSTTKYMSKLVLFVDSHFHIDG